MTSQSSRPVAVEPLPAHIDRYDVLARIGAGGRGILYKCSQSGHDHPVAVKLLTVSPGNSDRFQRELRAALRLSHPHIVQVHDIAGTDAVPIIVMEYVDGCGLDRLIGTPLLTLEKTLSIVFAIARALQSAHEQGVLHHDVKPPNILINKSGQPKLTDFGLARSLDDGPALGGDLTGTPRYLSPEQVLGEPEPLDARSDVYSLGAVMYEMLTGQPPVDGPNVMAVLRRLSGEEPVPVRVRNPDVPEAVAGICARAMARDREARYASAAQFAEAIQGYLLTHVLSRGDSPEPAKLKRPRRRLALAGALLLAVVVVATLWIGAQLLMSADSLARLRVQVNGPHDPAGGPPRERWAAAVDDLGALLKRAPNRAEARRLRARALQRGGECLAAVEDWNAYLRLQPADRSAVTDRLLALYQVHVLYPGTVAEPAVRPACDRAALGNLTELMQSPDPEQQYAARLIDALSRQAPADVIPLIDESRPTAVRPECEADLAMLEADVWFHAAEEHFLAELGVAEDAREEKTRQRENCVKKALAALRRGLDADPQHVGLQFLDAASLARRALWDGQTAAERSSLLRQQRPNFAVALDRLRRATLRRGPDTAVAQAVLFDQFGRDDLARDHLQDALGRRPALPSLAPFRVWVGLHAPADPRLTREELLHLLRELEPVFASPPEAPQPYFVRSLVRASSGQWDEARQDLTRCRTLLGRADLPTLVPAFGTWFSQAAASPTLYRDATQDVLTQLPVSPELRIGLGQEVLRRLTDAATVEQDGLSEDEVRKRTAWTHVRLARAYAEKQDRTNTLKQIDAALLLKQPEVTAALFREDGVFAPWRDDPEFIKAFERY